MPSEFTVRVNGDSIVVPVGSTVAIAIAIAGQPCRTSVTGEPRGPLCGMGICFECRAVVDGIPHSRTCQILCEPDMDVSTNE
jgi:D-hydroxyproline dehydrogenase subunit gamma